MRYGLTVTSAPSLEPVTLEEAKLFCRIDSPDFDGVLSREITAARQHFERITGRAVVTQTWRLTMDRFPGGCQSPVTDGDQFVLPGGRVASVTSITYVDTDESTQTMSASDYRVDTDQIPCRIEPAFGEVWPSALEITGSVKVTYVVGVAVTAVPAEYKQAILHAVAYSYDRPGQVDDKVLNAIFGPHWVGGIV